MRAIARPAPVVSQTLTFTVRGVNDAGEAPISTGDKIVIS